MSSYEDAPLPAHQKKVAMTAEEEEEERIKQEIWEAVNKTRQERHEREERERKEREARRKAKKARNPNSASKPRKPALPDDSEASEKLLQQRRKLEADRKRFAQMRAAAAKKDAGNDIDIVIASPSSPAQPDRKRRNQTPGPASDPPAHEKSPDSDSRTEPIKAKPIPMEEEESAEPEEIIHLPPHRPKETSRSTPPVTSNDDSEWKERYVQLQKRFEAEKQGKERIEQVLAQYENTINSLMAEQEEAVRSSGSSEEVQHLKQQNKELLAGLEATQAELEAVSEDHFNLAERYKELTTQSRIQQQNEQMLRRQVESLQQQLQSKSTSTESSGLPEESVKLERFRTATAKQIEVLKLRYMKAESQIASLQTELKGKTQENQKLTQISDSLIAMLENANLS